jgi:hypothetical protein
VPHEANSNRRHGIRLLVDRQRGDATAQNLPQRNVQLEGWRYPDDGAYAVTLDKETKVSGEASLHVKGHGTNRGRFSLSQGFKADAYRGQRLRYSGQIKTAAVRDELASVRGMRDISRAYLWLRIQDTNGQEGVINEMVDRSLKGTNDWTQCAIVVDVPGDAHKITLGAGLVLEGEIWVDGLKLEVVGKDVKPTIEPITGFRVKHGLQDDLPEQPANLDLEKEQIFIRPPSPGATGLKADKAK